MTQLISAGGCLISAISKLHFVCWKTHTKNVKKWSQTPSCLQKKIMSSNTPNTLPTVMSWWWFDQLRKPFDPVQWPANWQPFHNYSPSFPHTAVTSSPHFHHLPLYPFTNNILTKSWGKSLTNRIQFLCKPNSLSCCSHWWNCCWQWRRRWLVLLCGLCLTGRLWVDILSASTKWWKRTLFISVSTTTKLL